MAVQIMSFNIAVGLSFDVVAHAVGNTRKGADMPGRLSTVL